MNPRTVAVLTGLILLPAEASAQPLPPDGPRGIPVPPGALVIRDSNNTGGVVNYTIPRGATGADTYMSNSAAGGNVSRPELAVPNGSGGGGSSGSNR